jgi:hypothetical protein
MSNKDRVTVRKHWTTLNAASATYFKIYMTVEVTVCAKVNLNLSSFN